MSFIVSQRSRQCCCPARTASSTALCKYASVVHAVSARLKRRAGCEQRQVMSLLGQYSPSLFQEVFALLHEVVEGFRIDDWSAVTVRAPALIVCHQEIRSSPSLRS